MIELLNRIEFWHWWVFAALLMAVEVFAPTTLFLWTGISAAIVGLVIVVVPGLSWEMQVLLFAVLSVLSVVCWRVYARVRPGRTNEPGLNRRGQQYIGRAYVLSQPILNGRGKLVIDDTTWDVEGEDLDAGARVRLSAMEGSVFKVERD